MSAPAFLKSSLLIGAMTMISRFFGLLRDILLAALLGTSAQADAFVIAFRLPNLFRRLFAEGAFASAFIPVYLNQSQPNRTPFAATILNLLALFLFALTIIAEIFMENLVFLLAGGFAHQPEKFELAILLSRITFPYLIFMFITALYGALLNAASRFLAAAAAPILLNLALITAALLSWQYGGLPSLYLSWAVAISGILQSWLVIAAARRANLMAFPSLSSLPSLSFSPAIKKFFALLLPSLAAGGVVQLNIIIGTRIASEAPAAVSHLYYAERLYQLPLAVIGIAIGIALLPALTAHIHNPQQSQQNIARAMNAAMFLTLPAAAGLIIIAEPIIAALFQYGQFNTTDRQITALALAGFALGLPAFVAQKILATTFFARQNTKQPFLYALLAMIVNTALSLALFPIWGALGIASATAFAAWINTAALFLAAHRKQWIKQQWLPISRMILATTLMAAALYLIQIFAPLPPSPTERIFYLATLILIGITIYFILCLMLNLIHRDQLKELVSNKKNE